MPRGFLGFNCTGKGSQFAMGRGGKAVGNGQLPGKVLPGDSVRRQFSSPSGRLRARGAGGIPLGCSCGPGHVSGCCFFTSAP